METHLHDIFITTPTQPKSIFPAVLPRILPFNFGDEPSFTENFATVQCAVTFGDLPITIEWLHNGVPIPRNNDRGVIIQHSGRRVSTLTLESIRDFNAGNYSCLARNVAGSSEQSAELIVNGSSFRLSVY